MQEALEAMMAELVFGPELVGPEAVDAWIAGHALGPEHGAAMKASFERLVVYRTLVRETLTDAVRLAIPRTMARLDVRFDRELSAFLAERGPRTHYLRDVTMELIDFCEPRWKSDPSIPAYLVDLARHEALEIRVASSADAGRAPAGELDLDATLAFSPSLTLVHYEHAVHRLPADEGDRSVPEAVPTTLAVYRDAESDVRYLELTPLAALILGRLSTGNPLGRAVTLSCGEAGVEVTGDVIEGTSRLLADLADRGVIVGVGPLSGTTTATRIGGSSPSEDPR
jgi:hypothetical protein